MTDFTFGDYQKSRLPEGAEETSTQLRQAFQNRTVGDEEIENLPEEWQELYQKRAERKLEMLRKLEVKKQELRVKKILRKLKLGGTITANEEELLEEHGHKVSSIKSHQVKLNPTDLLTDIVNGDYTLQDIYTIREGDEDGANKDAVETSPLQFFDNIIEDVKEKTHEALKTKEPGNFFGSLESELTNNMVPGVLADAIGNAATAIELVHGNNDLETSEAKAACESYVKALAMNEAELKLKQVGELVNKKHDREATEKLAEVAAVSGALSEMGLQQNDTGCAPRKLSFDITELNYDISFLPTDDPETYKPLEIISYIGMTKKV